MKDGADILSSSGENTAERIRMRIPGYGYTAASLVTLFFFSLFLYFGLYLPGIAFAIAGLIAIPFFALTDFIVFDGKRLQRTGILPRFWAYINASPYWLRIRDIERVETVAFPKMKRGGRVFYRYRTIVAGRTSFFLLDSTGKGYRNMMRAILPLIPEDVLDNNSIEIRDHMTDPGKASEKAIISNIPPSDVLESSFRSIYLKDLKKKKAADGVLDGPSDQRVSNLHALGNELRLSGMLLQAMESFRRALLLRPNDAWLLFDFARCIQSFAGVERDPRLGRKAVAMFKLAERQAGDDAKLLARLGESYFEQGEWRRAGIAFKKAVNAVGEHYRSLRGLAEIALRDGKLAHVIHNFNLASGLAETTALRRWSRAEAEYFTKLNEDGEYMEMEIGRVNMLESLDRWKRITLRLAFGGVPFIALGLYFADNSTANAGWILSSVSIVLWMLIMAGRKMFASRISPDMISDD